MMTPSGRLLAEAARTYSAVDASGRRVSCRRLDALDRLRLFKALGAELSLNAPYLGMALLACSVTAIDDVPVPPPVTEEQLEALVRRLGDDGISAVSDALQAADSAELGRTDLGN
jgi:H2-forming N5,N10-methylenetetrahydromethanopterin dehydrogenase-like enzyme